MNSLLLESLGVFRNNEAFPRSNEFIRSYATSPAGKRMNSLLLESLGVFRNNEAFPRSNEFIRSYATRGNE
jgi:hypothetical protein